MKKIILGLMAVLFVGTSFAYNPTVQDDEVVVKFTNLFEKVIESGKKSLGDCVMFLDLVVSNTTNEKYKYILSEVTDLLGMYFAYPGNHIETTAWWDDVRFDLQSISTVLQTYLLDNAEFPFYDHVIKIQDSDDFKNKISTYSVGGVPNHPLDLGYYYMGYSTNDVSTNYFVLLASSTEDLCNFQAKNLEEAKLFLENNTYEDVLNKISWDCDQDLDKFYIYVY